MVWFGLSACVCVAVSSGTNESALTSHSISFLDKIELILNERVAVFFVFSVLLCFCGFMWFSGEVLYDTLFFFFMFSILLFFCAFVANF